MNEARKLSRGKKNNKGSVAKRLMRWKYVLFAIALLISFGSEVVSMGNEVGMRVVLTSLGIDRQGEDYVVSAQVFTPQLDETKMQNKSLVSVSAPTVAEALNRMNLRTGRIATISHCRLIVLGDSVMSENILTPLNYFVTSQEIGLGAIVVATSGEAKQTLNDLNTLEEKASFSWQKFLNSNREHDLVTVMSLRELLIRSENKSETALVNVIDISKPQSQGKSPGGQGGGAQSQESGGGQSQGGPGGGSGQSQDGANARGELKLGDRTYVVKKGRRVGELNEMEVRGFSWLDKKVDKALFTVEGIDDPVFGGAKVALRMRSRTLKCKYDVEDGVPVLTVRIKAMFDNVEVQRAEAGYRISVEEIERSGRKLQDAITREIVRQIELCRAKSIELDADLLGINEHFYQYRAPAYDEFGTDTFKLAKIKYDVSAKLSM